MGMSQKITVFSMQNCPYCTQAKNLLTQRGVPFEVVMTDDWPDQQWDELVQKSKMKTLPQIFAGEKLIGGYSQLADEDRKDQLAQYK